MVFCPLLVRLSTIRMVKTRSKDYALTYVPPGVHLPTRLVEIPISDITERIGARQEEGHRVDTITPLRLPFVIQNRDGTYAMVTDPLALKLDTQDVAANFIVAVEIERRPEYAADIDLVRLHSLYIDSNRVSMRRSEWLNVFFGGALNDISKMFVGARKWILNGYLTACLMLGDTRISYSTFHRAKQEFFDTAESSPNSRRSRRRTPRSTQKTVRDTRKGKGKIGTAIEPIAARDGPIQRALFFDGPE